MTDLRPADLETFARFGIDPALLEAAGVHRVTHDQAREEIGIRYRSDHLEGIVFPYRDPTSGELRTARLRRDHPEVEADGSPIAKYVGPPDRHHLYFPPGAPALLTDPSVPAAFVEAEKSALTLTAAAARLGRRVLAIGTGGCWGWKGVIGKTTDAEGARVDVKGPLSDLARVTWTNRDVVILFDANAASNTKVQGARRKLADDLQGRGARVRIGDVPAAPGINGPDDFRAAHTDAELWALLEAATPPHSAKTPRAERTEPIAVYPVIVNLADVQPEAVMWVWPGRLAAGKLALLVGDPGLGKSWISLDIAAHVSAGHAWPDTGVAAPIGDVLLLSAEDGLADTIRPRLDALGADVRRVHHLAVLRAGEHERAVQLGDATQLEQAIQQTHARVMIVDPVSAFVGTVDSHRDAEVRGLIAPLALLAERTGVAILGVMHLAKSANRPAIYRAVGSIAFAAAARIVLAVAADPNRPERRLVVPVKSNLSVPPATLAYTLADGALQWEADPVSDVDVDELLSGPPNTRDRDEVTEAERVIDELLEDDAAWPLDAREALKAAGAHGVADRTLQAAARRRGIRTSRIGFGSKGRWVWHRPAIGADHRRNTLKDDSVAPMAPLEDCSENPGDPAGVFPIGATSKTLRARARDDSPTGPPLEDGDADVF